MKICDYAIFKVVNMCDCIVMAKNVGRLSKLAKVSFM
jgi:hypothetical protein